jgi:hypothetical protein
MLPAWLVGWPALDLATIYVGQANWQPLGQPFISNSASIWTLSAYWSPAEAWNFRWVGLLAAAVAAASYLSLLPKQVGAKLIAAAALSAALMPFLLPGMHERFFMLADVLAYLYALIVRSPRSIVAALVMQLASAGPVFIWSFNAQPLELMAPILAVAVLFILACELKADTQSKSEPCEH